MNNNKNEYARHVSRLTRETLALVLAGGQGSRLHELTTWRAKPALYFGGKYRIIDFALSNCLNSGIRRIGVLTQYKAHSLIRHLVHGWSFLQAGRREFVGDYADEMTAGFNPSRFGNSISEAIQAAGGRFWGPDFKLLTANDVADAKDKDIGLSVWTVNTANDIRQMAILGVDFITTDRPALVLDVLG